MQHLVRARQVMPLLLCCMCFAMASAGLPARANSAPMFETEVRPILKAHCFHCHGEEEELQGGLDTRLQRFLVAGGESGPAIVPGDVDSSYLVDRIRSGEMPPGKKKLTPAEIAIIERWIREGAQTARPEPESLGEGLLITDNERAFWSFQPINRPEVPRPQHTEEVCTPIDAFLLHRLEQDGHSFSPETDRATLVRRLFFDALGLPPTENDVAAFLADTRPDAVEQLVERLLHNPHYGERWARYWLDVAGYADSEGYTPDDPVRPHAYRYRDYTVRAFNAGKPFDEFICEQLAGDEMLAPPYRNLTEEQLDKLVATGFLRMAPDGTGSGGVDRDEASNQTIADTVQIVSSAFLGMTVGCAQCHHHRYDPIPQDDYYRMRAVFAPAYDWKKWRTPRQRLISLYTDADRAEAARIEQEAAKIDAVRKEKQEQFIQRTFEQELAKLAEELRDPVRAARETPAAKRTDEQNRLLKAHPSVNVSAGSLYLYDRKAADELKDLAAQAAAIRATKPVEEFVRVLTEPAEPPPETFLFDRGDYRQPKQAIPPGGLTVLASLELPEIPADDPALPTSGRRLAFARRLTDGNHPLTARVIVNRIWMHHFGRGLVASAGDFGMLGDRPTHPELLDWLADEFMRSGWNVRHIQRLILCSTAYRQSSRRTEPLAAIDPDNKLLGRMNVRRLDAEAVRDAVLAVSGRLNERMYGEPIPVMEDEVGQIVVGVENLNGENRPGAVIPLHGDEYRRSIYVQVRRSRLLGVLETFDVPTMSPNCEVRSASTVAPQALLMLNSQFVTSQSEAFARRLLELDVANDRNRVARAWRWAMGRSPDEQELSRAEQYLAAQEVAFTENLPKESQTTPREAAWASFCQVLLGASEFLYVD